MRARCSERGMLEKKENSDGTTRELGSGACVATRTSKVLARFVSTAVSELHNVVRGPYRLKAPRESRQRVLSPYLIANTSKDCSFQLGQKYSSAHCTIEGIGRSSKKIVGADDTVINSERVAPTAEANSRRLVYRAGVSNCVSCKQRVEQRMPQARANVSTWASLSGQLLSVVHLTNATILLEDRSTC